MADHSPLPWKVKRPRWAAGWGVVIAADGAGLCYDDGEDVSMPLADAEFIVRAVNAHDELVAVLTLIRSRANGAQLQPHAGDEPVPEYFACVEIAEWADAALAKAEGR